MRLCFVVHRYAPANGGSEQFVKWMAEAAAARGHAVTVFTGGDRDETLAGVRVRSDAAALLEPHDLVVVHGANVGPQDLALVNAERLPAPTLYLIILPSERPVPLHGLRAATWLGCSTAADWAHAAAHGAAHKAVPVRHGIALDATTVGTPGRFRQKHGIAASARVYLSCGGYYAHKGMRELADAFRRVAPPHTVLVLTGYADSAEHRPPSDARAGVLSLLLEDKSDVADAMADADLYVMNSTEEGFGLVLLEAMANRLPWAARAIAGALELAAYAAHPPYASVAELDAILRAGPDRHAVDAAHAYVTAHRTADQTLDDVLTVLGREPPR